jgi:5-formyltetrahydrofolate cyclo-ligase
MGGVYSSKEEARQAVWDALERERVARFPFPPHGRIPNFEGAVRAAERLLAQPVFARARRIKVDPDAPQRMVRLMALRRGITVFVPTPRLRGGFRRFDPAKIPPDKLAEAASLIRGAKWGEAVALAELPPMDVIVTGSVAVTRTGKRCGKGHGYGDLEYAILRSLGYPEVPVATTVHPLQLVDDFPAGAHDQPLHLIVTPDEVIAVAQPQPAPQRIDWQLLTAQELQDMPILRELKAAQGRLRRDG